MIIAVFSKPFPAGCITGPVQVQRNSNYLEITNYLSMSFLFYFVDKAIHGVGDLGKVYTQPLTIECWGHRFVITGSDIDNTRDKAHVTIIARAIYRRNKFIVKVLCIL